MIETEDPVMRALRDFAKRDLTLGEFSERLRKLVTIDCTSPGSVEIQFHERLPDVLLHVSDIRRALQDFERGKISSDDLACWASIMSLLGCYFLETNDTSERTVIWNIVEALGVPLVSGAHEPDAIRLALRTLGGLARPDDGTKTSRNK